MVKEIKKENEAISLDTAIILCKIQDSFEEFSKGIKKIMANGNSITDIYRLYRLSIGEKIKDVKSNEEIIKFYLQNEEVINKIKKYCPLNDFILNNYTQDGNISGLSCVGELYKYLNEHKEEKDEIMIMLYKLKKLGFSNIVFDENFDFTTEKYSINNVFLKNSEVIYLDNIEVVPNYDFGVVEYKSNDSNYKIILKTQCFDFTKNDRTIALNSLLFDRSRLPKEINKMTTFDSIIELKEEQIDKYRKITGSVDFSVKIDDVSKEFRKLNDIVDKLDSMQSTKEIKQVLENVKGLIDNLKSISKEYDCSITKEKNITSEGLEKQKRMFLERRKWKKEDCC